jgi:hypothetical protein
MITPGTTAPTFTRTDHLGRTIDLAAERSPIARRRDGPLRRQRRWGDQVMYESTAIAEHLAKYGNRCV